MASDLSVPPCLPDPEEPFPGESLLSLIARYAGNIGMYPPSAVLAPVGLHGITLATFANRPHDGHATEALRTLLNLEEERFELLRSWSRTPKHSRILGHDLSSQLVSFFRRKFCAACLKRAPFHHALWDLTLLAACPIHGTILQASCGECSRPLRWSGVTAHCCPRQECADDLSEQDLGREVSAEIIWGCQMIAHLFADGVPGAWAPLSLNDTLYTAAALGAFAVGVNLSDVLTAEHDKPEMLGRAMAHGLRALENWPVGFHGYLQERREEGLDRKGRYGVNKELGPAAGWISIARGSSIGEVLGGELNFWAAGQPDLATRVVEVGRLRDTSEHSVTISVARAAERMGLKPGLFRKVAKRLQLYAIQPEGSGAMALIDVGALERLIDRRNAMVDHAGAARILGISASLLFRLCAAGLIPQIAKEERVESEAAYDKNDLAALLDRLEKAVSPPPMSYSEAVSAHEAAMSMPGGFTFLLTSVLDGSIRPVGIDETAHGFDRLLFSSEVKVGPPRKEHDGFISPGSLSQMFAVDRTSMTEMVAAGLFGPPEEGVWTSRSRPVSQQAAEKFRRDNIMTPEIASMSGVPWQGLVTKLARLNIHPISGPGVDGLRRHVFRRQEVEVVIEKLSAGRRSNSGNTVGRELPRDRGPV